MRLAAAQAFRIWPATYETAPNALLELESAVLPEYFGPLEGKLLVDIGCGAGRWAHYAQCRGARIIGLDASREMLLQAAGKPALCGALVRADAVRLPLTDAIADVLLCSFVICYLPSLEDAAGEMARISRRGARILITDLHADAIAAGWKRSFRHENQVYELEHSVYHQSHLIDAFCRAGLLLQNSMSLHFDERQRGTFQRAGKEHVFEDACRIPAISVGIWTKA